jgi:uncharacterized protein
MTDLELAIEQFNRGDYFEQHETLERMWRAEPGPVRGLYQGILQVGVGLYHLERGNYDGALHLLERGIARLAAYAPASNGIDVAQLVADARLWHSTVAALAAGQVCDIDWDTAPKIHVVN